jgi:hypothetical protein
MSLVGQWQRIEPGLPPDWAEAQLELVITDEAQAERAAALLGPLAPGRFGKQIRFFTARRGAGPVPDAVARLLARLDEEPIDGRLELLSVERAAVAAVPAPKPTLVTAWDAAVAELPDDWSDLHAEVELTSSDHLDGAALLMAPLNPSRYGPILGFRYRVARRFGYGASPQMARRCLARLDEDGIPGKVRILRALSETRPVATQGPVWYVDGKVV